MMKDILDELEFIIQDRKNNPTDSSYTSQLFASGKSRIAQKVGEEAVEVVVAALSQGEQQQIAELADLFYHMLVLMSDLEIRLDDIKAELIKRHQIRKGSSTRD